MAFSKSFHAVSLFFAFILNITFFSNTINASQLQPWDTITWGGDTSRSGYQTTHNMDPSIVGSSSFGQLWIANLPGTWPQGNNQIPEQIFSQPLLLTLNDGVQYIFVATTQNNIYKLNAKTGVIMAKRNMHRPFLTADLDGCVDINPTVGVTSTGVLDPNTDTWYLTAKTYINQNNPVTQADGRPAGRYYLHAIDINSATLADKNGFPVNMEGIVARNNPIRSFNGGIHHQRPALLQAGQYIYAGFASHCVKWNFTGWIMGFDKDTGAVVERWATEGQGVPNTTPGGGIWMSGGGLAYDNKGSMFFATGNGYAGQLSNTPVNGRTPPTAFEEAAVHMTIADDGSLTVVDFFMPYEKQALDGADKDLGTSPLEILPSSTFSCGDVKRIGVVTGKSGKTYFLNLDDLGGYQNGPNKGDRIIGSYQNENSVYAGAGVYPLEGGYIYINVIQWPTRVFKFNCINNVPSFSVVAYTNEKCAYILGVGHGTVTSLNDQPGTGLVWVSDVEGVNLRIYNAVPPVGGNLIYVKGFNTVGVTKFTRPVFGNGIVYQGTTLGKLYAYGSPVNLPLVCSPAPAAFPTTLLNQTSASNTVQCQNTAGAAVIVNSLTITGNKNFVIGNYSSTLPITVPAGQNFSFTAAFAPIQIGPLSSNVNITLAPVQTFAGEVDVQLTGVCESVAPVLATSPNQISFDSAIVGSSPGGFNQTAVWSNVGNTLLSNLNVRYSLTSEQGPWLDPSDLNGTSDAVQIGPFTLFGIPTNIPGKSSAAITINFTPTTSGNFGVYMQINSNGGSKIFDVFGVGSQYPVALLEFQTPDGSGWVKYDNSTPFTFGNVLQGATKSLKMRLTNAGTNSSAKLSVTVSKPPFGVPGIIGANNQVDLAEGVSLTAGQSQTATLYCSPPVAQYNTPTYNGTATWTMNLDDPTFGKHFIPFICFATSQQGGPLLNSTTALYTYAGCYAENNPGRQLKTQVYASTQNNNTMCMNACYAQGYTFAGTEYNSQCWCGNNRPSQVVADANCNYACSGDVAEICGGNGVSQTGSFISLFADRTKWDGNQTSPTGPYVNPGAYGFNSMGCYTEATSGKALSVTKSLGTGKQTVRNCLQACAGYSYAGVEYGGECYCGNSFAAGAASTLASSCSMTCNNNDTEYCGNGGKLNMYGYGFNGTAVTSPSSSSSTSSAVATSSSAVPTSLGNFQYLGCYNETHSARALADANNPRANSNSNTLCAAACAGYKYFGNEYYGECYCSNNPPAQYGNVGTNLNDNSILDPTGVGCNTKCNGDNTQICGGADWLSVFTSVAQGNTTSSSASVTSTASSASVSASTVSSTTSSASPTSTIPVIVQQMGNYTYQNCSQEATNNQRALADKTFAADTMTVNGCAQFCQTQPGGPYAFMAIEYARECYCGKVLNSPGASKQCTMVCKGNNLQYCGGPNALQLYSFMPQNVLTSTSSTFSSTSTSALTSTSTSTITSTTNGTISTVSTTSASTSSSTIASTSAGSTSSSTSTLSSTSTSSTSVSASTSTLTTALSTSASASTSISTSSTASSTSGTDSTSISTSILTSTTASSTSASASTSISTSSTASSTSGTDSTSISTSISTSSITVSTSSSSSTSITSSSTSTSTIASSTSSSTSTSTSTSITPTSTSTSTSSTTSAPSTTSTVSTTSITPTLSTTSSSTTSKSSSTTSSSTTSSAIGPAWTSLGCANEVAGRALTVAGYADNAMTVAKCQAYCLTKQSALAGVEYGRECYCGNQLSAGVTVGGQYANDCNMMCGGNDGNTCGAANRLNIYNNTAFQPPVIPASSSNYKYVGCYAEPSTQRALQAYSFTNSTTMTVDLCVGTCSTKGYAFAGVEYGQECFCDNVIQGQTTSTKKPDSDCQKMTCPGNSQQYCANGNRLEIYQKSS